MKNKTTVVYHSGDFDGKFCREIARKFLPDAELIGWNFGDPPIQWGDGVLYVLDLPVDEPLGFKFGREPVPKIDLTRIRWLDHHKSSIESHPKDIPGYRIDGVAACRLAWQWFTMIDGNTPRAGAEIGIPIRPAGVLPMVQDYKNREVNEPLAVRLAGEYDIWDKRDPDAELFQHGLRSRELTDQDWNILLGSFTKPTIAEIEAMMDVGHPLDLRPDGTVDASVSTVKGLLRAGEALQYARTKENASIIKELGFTMHWEGLTFLACNAVRYNSLLFTAGLKPEHDACFGFKWTGNDWSISLYHAPGKEHHDLSKIAVRFGGGGHAGACGFHSDTLPFGKHNIPLSSR